MKLFREHIVFSLCVDNALHFTSSILVWIYLTHNQKVFLRI